MRTANKLALKRMLAERSFAELTRVLAAFQQVSETDCSRELLALDAFEAFQSADPSLTPLLDDWVKEAPDSYIPLVARAHHWSALARERRGSKWASETTRAQWKGMRDADVVVATDLKRSLELHRTAAAYRALIGLETRDPSAARVEVEAGLQLCPASLQLHAKIMGSLTPRWGGSYEAMLAFAGKAPVERNPKLVVLPGFVDLDLASVARSEGRPKAALRHAEKALQAGPYWEFLLDKAKSLLDLRRNEEALEAIEAAIEQRPQKARAHALRAIALCRLGEPDHAQSALAYGQAIDPYDPSLRGVRCGRSGGSDLRPESW
ncbi:MAG: DUF4034 domain-containing protein [Myxococcales bacterium]